MAQSQGFDRSKKIIICIIDVILYHISFVLSFLVRYEFDIPTRNYLAYSSAQLYIFIAFILLNILFGIYILYNKQKMDFIYLTVIVQFVMALVIMAMTFFGRWFTFPRTIIFISFVISSIILIFWRIIVFKLYEKIDGTKKVMVVGSKNACIKAVRNFENSKNNRHKITKMVLNNYYDNIVNHMEQVDIVYLAERIPEREKIRIYDYLIRHHKKLFLNTNFENLVLVNPNIMSIEDESIIEASSFSISPEDDIIKRLIDIGASLVILTLTSPVILVTAILVKLTSPGPVFYKQIRITKGEKEFGILKFRTMSATAEKESGPVLATANDTRITPIGRYLRSLRIDELPQLFNVLIGEMSLVGPRPERPFFVEQFKKKNHDYYLRHNVRAGITGYAQVYGKYATDFNSKLNFDLVYIKKFSFVLDIKIMLQTIKILFDKVSSQGIEDEKLNPESMPDNIEVLK